jgi:hypothetical protein
MCYLPDIWTLIDRLKITFLLDDSEINKYEKMGQEVKAAAAINAFQMLKSEFK